MTEQILIDILYFIFHYVFQWLSYFVILTFMLTPKYNRAYIVLFPFAIAFSKPVFPLLDDVNVSTFILYGMLFFTALTAFKEKKRICLAAIAASTLLLVLMSLVASLVIYDMLGYYPTELFPYTWDTVIYTIILDIFLWILYGILLLVWNRLIKKKSVKSLGYFWLFPIGQIAFICACMFRAKEDMGEYLLSNPYLLAAMLLSVVSDILMYRAIKENSRVQDMKQTISRLESEMELQLKYYDALAVQYSEIREYRHDIRNMIAAAETLSMNKDTASERNALLCDMEKKADSMNIPVYCADPLVNAVLWQKSVKAKNKRVAFHAYMDIAEKFGMERIDTCSLLVNLLDNAIDEAAKEENGTAAITVRRKAGLLFIETSNSTERILSADTPKPRTAKKGDHGHGIDIIEKIVSKYGGCYTLRADGKTAHTAVSLDDSRPADERAQV